MPRCHLERLNVRLIRELLVELDTVGMGLICKRGEMERVKWRREREITQMGGARVKRGRH